MSVRTLSEAERCRSVAEEIMGCTGCGDAVCQDSLQGHADVIQRERAAARAEGYQAGVEAAAVAGLRVIGELVEEYHATSKGDLLQDVAVKVDAAIKKLGGGA